MDTAKPYDVIPNGTKVNLPGKKGIIVRHEKTPNGIIVHSIRIEERYNWPKRKWVSCTPEIWKGNYSFIQY